MEMLTWENLAHRKFLILLVYIGCIGAVLMFTPEAVANALIPALTLVAGTYGGIQMADDIAARIRGLERQGNFASKKFRVAFLASVGITVGGIIGIPPNVLEIISEAVAGFFAVQGGVDLIKPRDGQ